MSESFEHVLCASSQLLQPEELLDALLRCCCYVPTYYPPSNETLHLLQLFRLTKMFQSFTGNSRRPRQVNLSGRNTNPFAASPSTRQPSTAQGAQNALIQAQQERLLRQQERDRLNAAKALQRIWRGYHHRQEVKSQWRQEWDCRESPNSNNGRNLARPCQDATQALQTRSYDTMEDCLSQLRLLLQFASTRSQFDRQRIHLFARRFCSSLEALPDAHTGDTWVPALLRLGRLCLETLRQSMNDIGGDDGRNDLLTLLITLSAIIPEQLALYSLNYYAVLGALTILPHSKASVYWYDHNLLENAVLGLLQPKTSGTISAYAGFASEYLTIPDLPSHSGRLDTIAKGIDYKLLAKALTVITRPSSDQDVTQRKTNEELLWLLAYFIFFRRCVHGVASPSLEAPDVRYVSVISRLLSNLADEIGARIDLPGDSQRRLNGVSSRRQHIDLPLPDFVHSEVLTLVNQQNISNLLTHSELVSASNVRKFQDSEEASAVASYALMLLRVFPRKRDDIRMWLLLGSTPSQNTSNGQTENSIPAIKYFWRSASTSRVYELIRQEPGAALSLLRPDATNAGFRRVTPRLENGSEDQEWRILLLFLELYTLALRLMDDEEFFSGGTSSSAEKLSWTRASALTLGQVRDLTVFLKNLAFTMYWNAAEISGPGSLETKAGIGNYFSTMGESSLGSRNNESSSDADKGFIAGVTGMTANYIKGMVTGLLRMIYERE